MSFAEAHILRAETINMRKSLLILSLTKLRQNTEVIWKSYEPFIYRDIHYITKRIWKVSTV
jgi:hypothetical protein